MNELRLELVDVPNQVDQVIISFHFMGKLLGTMYDLLARASKAALRQLLLPLNDYSHIKFYSAR